MNKYEKIIASVKDNTSFLGMIKCGVKPHEIKEAIIKLLEPYFDNKTVLERFAIDNLVVDSVFFLKVQSDIFFFKKFEKCLGTYHSAKSKDPQSCFEACAHWCTEVCESELKFWSVANLEVDKRELELEDFVHECLKNIGELIEGLAKPYLKVLLAQNRITRKFKGSIIDIDTLELGKIVNELIDNSGYTELFIPSPWKVSLSQWRNIAYHHSAKIKNGKIVCWWGRQPNINMIELSRNELIEVVSKIFKTYGVIKLAHTLFFVDNYESICALGIDSSKEQRKESELLNFTVGLASQGFEIVEFEKSLDEARLVVRDVSDLQPDERRYHASQFLFPLWRMTRSKKVITEYREKDNTPNLRVSISSTICEKIFNGALDLYTLPKRMEMLDLKRKRTIPAWKDS